MKASFVSTPLQQAFGLQYLSVILIVVCLILQNLQMEAVGISSVHVREGKNSTESHAVTDLGQDTKVQEMVALKRVGRVPFYELFDPETGEMREESYWTIKTFYSSHEISLRIVLFAQSSEDFATVLARSISLQRRLAKDGYLDSDISVIASQRFDLNQAVVSIYKRESA
ncbi:MAG: hypothetical protein KDD64_13485 [Bdellovibrionales bacterium]|nr:hypothetical protein [Bdellovibrionales bacterium]